MPNLTSAAHPPGLEFDHRMMSPGSICCSRRSFDRHADRMCEIRILSNSLLLSRATEVTFSEWRASITVSNVEIHDELVHGGLFPATAFDQAQAQGPGPPRPHTKDARSASARREFRSG